SDRHLRSPLYPKLEIRLHPGEGDAMRAASDTWGGRNQMKTPMHRISSRSMSNVLAAGLLLAGLAAGARAQDLAPGSRPGIAGEREGPREGDPRRRDRYWQRLN